MFKNNVISVEEWFRHYKKLIDFGARQIKNIEIGKHQIKLTYTNYSKGKKKEFVNFLPTQIFVDADFQYFFGLWCGDRLGSGRFGVCNKNKDINMFTSFYLKKLHQQPKFILQYSNLKNIPKLDYPLDGYYECKSSAKGYVINVGVVNGILFSLFDYFRQELDTVLTQIPDKALFFAGLFDAEGNVFLEDSCFRWACLNMREVEIYKKHLNELGLYHRYDGCNLVTYNKEAFIRFILPYLKHPDKINKARLVCYGIGTLDKRLLAVLHLIHKNPGLTHKIITKTLKRAKRYAQIKFLEKLGYLKSQGYPKRLYITAKGMETIQEGRT